MASSALAANNESNGGAMKENIMSKMAEEILSK